MLKIWYQKIDNVIVGEKETLWQRFQIMKQGKYTICIRPRNISKRTWLICLMCLEAVWGELFSRKDGHISMKVNLGAGRQAYEHSGYVSVDIIPSDGIDYIWDCENGLPKRL